MGAFTSPSPTSPGPSTTTSARSGSRSTSATQTPPGWAPEARISSSSPRSPAPAPPDGYAGLFHFALLLPDRPALAAWLAHAARDRVALTGLSDHAVSEAIYLRDPDHHGIEIYADRPRPQWEGRVKELMTTMPLDTDDLLSAYDGAPWTQMAAGTTMGHVHFRVSDVTEATAFWRDVIGLEVMASFAGQAGFYASGGYHHHVGANVWESRGAPVAPSDHASAG